MVQGYRNYNIDACKAILALLVVYIHFSVPYYSWIKPFSSCAVPVFYLISGYYIFRDDNCERVKKTLIRIFKLTFVWGVIFLLYDNLYIDKWTDFIIYSPLQLMEVFLFNRFAHGYHLWYLSSYYYALAIILLLYRWRLIKYKNTIATILLMVHFIIGCYSEYIFGTSFPFFFTRNGFLWALPLLLIGGSIREWVSTETIEKNRYLLLLILAFFYGGNIVGIDDFVPSMANPNIPTIIATIVIFLFMLSTGNGKKTVLSKIGKEYSLYIYILHMFFLPLETRINKCAPFLIPVLPIVIYFVSLLLSIIIVSFKKKWNEKFSR